MNINDFRDKAPGLSIAILGDVCLDLYYFLSQENTEVSVETGLRTNSVKEMKFEAGGAANVAVNLKHLGVGRVDLYGIVGSDSYGKALRDLLDSEGVSTECLVSQKDNWQTNVYHKVYEGQRELPRYDIGNFNMIAPRSRQTILKRLEENLESYQAVIINQQLRNGVHDGNFQDSLNRLIKHCGDSIQWFCDSRDFNDVYRNTIHKLNFDEALGLYGLHGASDSKESPSSETLLRWLGSYWNRSVVMTRGADGASAYDASSEDVFDIKGLHIIDRIDTVGAGDAFLAALVASSAAGMPLKDAAEWGNFAAAVSVTKLYETGHPSLDEIKAISRSPEYRYNPVLASDPRKAEMLPETQIEVIHLRKDRMMPEIMIFDHDGTISTLRQGWEEVMRDLMIRFVFGNHYEHASLKELEDIGKTVDGFIEATTGVQTILQMRGLVKLISSYDYVGESELLSPAEYKAVYNRNLLEKIAQKVSLFESGRIGLDDVTLKGAVPFLCRLRDAGVTLYLASGTDQDDVREEARLLGYDTFFNGGIFGSVGNPDRDPKRVVLENICREIGSSGRNVSCAVFGDGPVEMREAKRNGFLAVGLISDEVRRFGPNPRKRERLILGGADYLIPDFSWSDSLSSHFGWSLY